MTRLRLHMRFLAAAAGVALCAALAQAEDFAKAVSHQVSVSFSPRVITLGQNATLTVTVKNPQGGGNRAGVGYTLVLPAGLTISGVNIMQDCYDNGSGFTATPSIDTVTLAGLNLRPGGTCTVQVTVGASAPGEYAYAANAVNVNSNSGSASNAAGTSLTVNPAPAPSARLSASGISFGSQLVGTSSAPQSVTISNGAGGGPLAITAVSVSPDFSYSSNCTSSVAAGGSCTISIAFTPAASGARSGVLQVSTNDAASPHLVQLSGTGTAPAITLTPSSVDFGTLTLGAGPATSQVVLRNTGSAVLTLGSLTIAGAGFAVSSCPASVAPLAACDVVVTFSPATAGSYAGELRIVSNAATSPSLVTLAGSAAAAPAPIISLLTTASIDFGSVARDTFATSNVILKNTGNAPLGVTGISLSGSGLFTQTNDCAAANIAPQSTCQIAVRYSPTVTGPHAGQLTVQSNGGAAIVIGLAGTGVAPGVSLSPSPVNFGPVVVGGTATAPVTLRNSGTAVLVVSGVTTSGAPFTQTGSCAGANLAPEGSCLITVAYAPTVAGAHAGQLNVQSNAGTFSVSLYGSGAVPVVELSRTSVAFAPLAIGGSSPPQAVTLKNIGNAPLDVGAIAVAGDFASTGCAASRLAPGESCALSITFIPAATGARAGTLRVTSNASATAEITLAGEGLPAPAPALRLSTTSIDFGSQAVGTESSARTVTLTNSGTAALNLDSVATGGDYVRSGCAAPATIPVGGSCVLSLVFRPTAGGPRPGSIQIATNAAGSPHSVSLAGTGTTTPGIAFDPESLDYGSIPTRSSVLLRVALKSTGTRPLAIASISIEGAAFTQTNTCAASLLPGAVCDIWVEFFPTATGTHSGRLIVQTDAPGGSSVVPLTGTAAPPPPPRLSLSRGSVDFGLQTVGVASGAQVATLTNPGVSAVEIASITVTGSFGFEGCATPLTLVAGESCDLAIRFLPITVGPNAGSIAISSNAADAPHSIVLSGAGTPVPVPGIAAAPSSVNFGSINAGASLVTHVAFTNTGAANLLISSITTSATVFTQTNTCPGTLAPSAACTVSVTYAPTAAGSHSGELRVASNAVPSPLAVPLSGDALPAPIPVVRLSNASVAFGALFVGVTSSVKTVTLSNAGTAPLRIANIVSTGDFGYSGCGFPTTIAAGDACVFSITFKPLSVGTLTGAIEVANDAPGSPHTISLSGTGASFAVPEISLAPSHLAFGSLRTGSAVTQIMRLTNAGASALQISRIHATGDHFTQVNACAASLPVGAHCDIALTYAPITVGAHSGQLHIESNAVISPHVAPLSGNAIAVPPPLLAVERSVDFGQQVSGTTARQSLRLANTGGEPLLITAARILGATEFGIVGTCTSILPGGSCALDLTFTPSGVRSFGARLDIVSNHSGGVVQVDLAGAGVPKPLPDLELSVAGLGWGNQVVGTLGEERVVKLTSVGGEAVRINSIAADRDFIVNASQCPALLQPQRSCDVSVTFKPVAPGPRTGRLVIDSNAVGEPDSVSLTGIGCRLFTMGAARNPSRLCAP